MPEAITLELDQDKAQTILTGLKTLHRNGAHDITKCGLAQEISEILREFKEGVGKKSREPVDLELEAEDTELILSALNAKLNEKTINLVERAGCENLIREITILKNGEPEKPKKRGRKKKEESEEPTGEDKDIKPLGEEESEDEEKKEE
jgi:hypothetical protein